VNRARAHATAELLREHLDLVEERPTSAEPPASLTRRGWDSFLLSLADDDVDAQEAEGLRATFPMDAPASLLDLVRRAREIVDVPELAPGPHPALPHEPRAHTTPRKDAQLDALAALVMETAGSAARVLDVGSGHGHLTREIAARLGRPVIGVERNAALVERARELAGNTASAPAFLVADVVRGGLTLHEGDCVVGLHACGELGDEMVRSAGLSSSTASLVLVGCCLQKRGPLVRAPLSTEGIALSKAFLGLSNLVATEDGVEATREENLAARERRVALAILLERAGVPIRPQGELLGLNRRSAHQPLDVLAARVFARAQREPPTRAALDDAAAEARVVHARMRRFALPRALLARVLEVSVAFDRALFLEEHGFEARVGELFPASTSPRNLAIAARR
jgi:SAM-dependent methyltransferase